MVTKTSYYCILTCNIINNFTFPGLFESESNDTGLLKDIATKLQLHELANDIEKRRCRSAGKKKNKNKSKWGTIRSYKEFT